MTTSNLVLPYNTSKSLMYETGLLVSAVLLPALCHLAGVPGNILLPMHWPVLLAGLMYGWRAGALIGAGAVMSSFLLSGMPPAAVLPFMTPEIVMYGFASGMLREVFKQNYFISLTGALVLGKLTYAALAFVFIGKFSFIALMPGAGAVLAQILLLPVIADKWTKKLQ